MMATLSHWGRNSTCGRWRGQGAGRQAGHQHKVDAYRPSLGSRAGAPSLCLAPSAPAASPAHLVGDQHGGLVAEHAAHTVLEDVLGGVVVHGRQRVVLHGWGRGGGLGWVGVGEEAAEVGAS